MSRVESRWEDGELSHMKVHSKSRQGSPGSRTMGNSKFGREDSIKMQDFKAGATRLTHRVTRDD